MNKLCKSKIAFGLYIVAALLGILFLVMLISSIAYISNYAASYGVSISELGSEAVTYILGNSITYLIYGIVVFAAGRILDLVTDIKAGIGSDSAAKETTEEAAPEQTKSIGAEASESAAAAADVASTEAAGSGKEAEAEALPAKGPVPPLYTERSIFNY